MGQVYTHAHDFQAPTTVRQGLMCSSITASRSRGMSQIHSVFGMLSVETDRESDGVLWAGKVSSRKMKII